MKKINLLLLIMWSGVQLHAQTFEDALVKMAKSADLVFEGRLIKKVSFWDLDHHHIYTANYFLVSKEFKGNFTSDTVPILSGGGCVGSACEDWSADHGLSGEAIFFCALLREGYPNVVKNKYYWGNNGNPMYIGYKTIEISPNNYCCDSTQFKNMDEEIYKPLEKITGKSYVKLRPNYWGK